MGWGHESYSSGHWERSHFPRVTNFLGILTIKCIHLNFLFIQFILTEGNLGSQTVWSSHRSRTWAEARQRICVVTRAVPCLISSKGLLLFIHILCKQMKGANQWGKILHPLPFHYLRVDCVVRSMSLKWALRDTWPSWAAVPLIKLPK